MAEIQEINLHIDGQVFTVKKDILCEHSDYFRAMLMGNYVEKDQSNITIDVVDATSMNIIKKFLEFGSIDLSEYTHSILTDLAMTVDFFQIITLKKQVEDTLYQKLTPENCMKTMAIAEQFLYTKLEHSSKAFALISFKSMKPEYIPTIDRLFWYLSHPCLDTDNEMDVFKFGFDWISQTETGGDALLIILGCLDIRRITSDNLKDMALLIKDFKNSLAEKVLRCLKGHLLIHISCKDCITIMSMSSMKAVLCEIFTERVYKESYNIVLESKPRKLKYTPVVLMRSYTDSDFMYSYETDTKCFDKWLQMAEKDLGGWNVVTWGPTKLVVVCGQHAQCTGSFMTDVIVYDMLTKEWTYQGVQLPPRHHGGVALLEDSLFIVGGVNEFGTILDTAIVYDLKKRTYRQIAKLPDPIKSPSVCCHKGAIYVAVNTNIYVYKDVEEQDCWSIVITSVFKPYSLLSFKDNIYCCSYDSSVLLWFQPEVDDRFQEKALNTNPVAICSLNTHLLLFVKARSNKLELLEFWEIGTIACTCMWCNPSTLCILIDMNFHVVGSGVLLMTDLTSLHTEVSKYHQRYLSSYSYVSFKRSSE